MSNTHTQLVRNLLTIRRLCRTACVAPGTEGSTNLPRLLCGRPECTDNKCQTSTSVPNPSENIQTKSTNGTISEHRGLRCVAPRLASPLCGWPRPVQPLPLTPPNAGDVRCSSALRRARNQPRQMPQRRRAHGGLAGDAQVVLLDRAIAIAALRRLLRRLPPLLLAAAVLRPLLRHIVAILDDPLAAKLRIGGNRRARPGRAVAAPVLSCGAQGPMAAHAEAARRCGDKAMGKRLHAQAAVVLFSDNLCGRAAGV